MRYEWDEEKRKSNLKDHSLDFVDVESVFAGPTFTFEDNRFAYHEQRFVTLGLLRGIPVSVVHTESGEVIRPISFRKATDNETIILFQNIADQLPSPPVAEKSGHPPKPGTSGGRRKARRSRHRKKRPKGRAT